MSSTILTKIPKATRAKIYQEVNNHATETATSYRLFCKVSILDGAHRFVVSVQVEDSSILKNQSNVLRYYDGVHANCRTLSERHGLVPVNCRALSEPHRLVLAHLKPYILGRHDSHRCSFEFRAFDPVNAMLKLRGTWNAGHHAADLLMLAEHGVTRPPRGATWWSGDDRYEIADIRYENKKPVISVHMETGDVVRSSIKEVLHYLR